MPHHFELDVTQKIFLVVLVGEVGNDEMRAIYEELKKLAGELDVSAGIMDMSDVTKFDVDPYTIRWLAEKPPSFARETPRFIVAPKSDIFGMSRMYELMADRVALQVVRSREAALAALGAPAPQFEKLPAK